VPKILIVAPNWVGDTLLAQPLFMRLRRRLPGVVLHALAPPWTAPVLARMPEIAEVIEAPFEHGRLQLRERWRTGRRLRARRYQEAIVLPNSFKSALVPFFADIPLRVGYVGESRYGLLNLVHKLEPARHALMVDRYTQLAERPGEPLPKHTGHGTLVVDPANLIITLSRLGLDRRRSIVVFCPGAEFGPAKRWPARHFAELARRLAEQQHVVWLIGSPKDKAIGAEIVRLSDGNAHNLCGRTDLAGAIDLISVSQLVVSNDSGLMHVASALDKPTIALYGSSSPEHTPPLNERARILKLQGLQCSPCYKRECPLGHFRCMNDLLPEHVLDEIRALWPTGRVGVTGEGRNPSLPRS
jgi:heptosyltransferase-2